MLVLYPDSYVLKQNNERWHAMWSSFERMYRVFGYLNLYLVIFFLGSSLFRAKQEDWLLFLDLFLATVFGGFSANYFCRIPEARYLKQMQFESIEEWLKAVFKYLF